MKPIRLYIDRPITVGGDMRLDKASAHYLGNVMRLREGAVVHVFNGEGGYYIAAVESIRRQAVTILPREHVAEERESGLDITLLQGLARGQKMDYTIQKAVELGVNRIVPVASEFSQVKLSPGRADKRLAHWQGVVIHACEQCGRNRLPRMEPPIDLAAWLEQEAQGTKWMLHPGASRFLADGQPSGTGRITLLAGPEGGLSDSDRGLAERAGYEAVSLGPRVLRTETAAVAALAVCQALWGDLRRP